VSSSSDGATAPVEVRELSKRFGAVRALDRVNARVPPASIALVSGPNGAGKSTLLRVIAGLCRPSSGELRVFGGDPLRDVALRARIGYVGAGTGLYGELGVRENLLFCARLHAVPRDRVERVLVELDLTNVSERRLRTLSLGFRRRAALARAVLPEPDLLLLDEPWNGLDSDARRRLELLLAAHRARGGTALIAAHGASDELLFDHELALSAGRVSPAEEAPA